MRSNYKSVQDVEGPFWDFTAISDRLTYWRNTYACVAAEYLLQSLPADALRAAEEFKRLDTQLERVGAYYDAHKGEDSRWIGWRP